MNQLPACPRCACEFTYELGALLVCPECAHEWAIDSTEDIQASAPIIKDAVGNTLVDGDTVITILTRGSMVSAP